MKTVYAVEYDGCVEKIFCDYKIALDYALEQIEQLPTVYKNFEDYSRQQTIDKLHNGETVKGHAVVDYPLYDRND